MSKVRNWCFTYNNYPENLDDFNAFLAPHMYVYGMEIAPTTGTPHLQGYVSFTGGKTFETLRKRWPGCTWIVAKGNRDENFKYCTKGGVFVSSHREGFPKEQQGKRSDLEITREQLQNNGSMRAIVMAAKNMQSIRFAETYLKYHEPGRDWKPHVSWIFGPSGSGKSTRAKELCPNAWWSGKNSKWFDGYDAHEEVVIDDLRAEDWPYVELLRMLDSKPYRVEYKGGSRQFLARRIVITTLYPPDETYARYAQAHNEPIIQLLRRIDDIIRVGEPGP